MVRRKRRSKIHTAEGTTRTNSTVDERERRTVVLIDKNKARYMKNHIMQEIKNLQQSTKLIIPRAPFGRLVREIVFDLFPRQNISQIQLKALEALQESAEMYIVQYFEDATLLCLHGKRVTLMQKDMVLLRRIRGRNDIINK